MSVQTFFLIIKTLWASFIKCLYTHILSKSVSKLKGIVHPKMKIRCLSAYPQGIQDVGDFVSSVEHKHRLFYSNRCSLSVTEMFTSLLPGV